jgi:TonB family protein
MNWLHYLLEANLYLGVFYAVYYLFLSNDTHYALNRVYLLATSVISFVIPLLQLGFLKPVEPQLISLTLIAPTHPATISSNIAPIEVVSFTWQDGLIWAYLLGVAVLFIIFSIKIYQLVKLTRVANAQVDPAYKLIYVDDSNTAFSFFNYLFIGTKSSGTDTIIQHELVHIRQKHSADIILIELLKIVNWFNPFIYLLQASVKTLHEYIADEQTATNGNDVIAYSTFLVNNAYGLSGSSVTHSFFNYNLLKKRIIMLNQQRSGNLARLKYLLIFPIIAGLLCASTLAFSKSYGIVDLLPNKIDSPLHPRYDVWNKSYDHTFTTSKGYRVRERVIFINGAVSKTAEIFDEAGQKHIYEARFISPKESKFVKDVFGYQFPLDTVIKAKLAPPPPPKPPVNVSKHKLLPPPPAPKPVNVHLVPPPPPMNPDFVSLYNYMYETLSYPANAKLKLKTGTVGVSFKLTADNKITDVKVIDAAGGGFDEEVVKVLSSFKGIVKPISKHNYYVMGITFNLLGEGSQSNIMAKNPGDDIGGASNYTCIVNVYSYIK